MRWWRDPLCTRPSRLVGFLVLAYWNNSLWIDMSPHSDTLFWFLADQFLLFLLNAVFLALWHGTNLYMWLDITHGRWLHASLYSMNHMGGIMVSVLASIAVDCGFELWSGQTKDYKISICCFFAKNTALRRKSKNWSARNQNNVSEWGDISIHRLLFQ
jgi:hypothetical protein